MEEFLKDEEDLEFLEFLKNLKKDLEIKVIDKRIIVIPKMIANSIINDFKHTCCNCCKEGKMMRCNRCYSAHYCCKECQKENYNEHKNICRLIAESVGNKNKTYGFNQALSNVFVGCILKNVDMPKKLRKKKFWKFLTDPKNGDYVFWMEILYTGCPPRKKSTKPVN